MADVWKTRRCRYCEGMQGKSELSAKVSVMTAGIAAVNDRRNFQRTNALDSLAECHQITAADLA